MHLLYAGESGTPADPKQIYFVLAGICVFERQCYWISNELDKIAARFDPVHPGSIELHGSPMFGGKNYWRKVPKEDRIQAIKDALNVLNAAKAFHSVFGCIVRKSALPAEDPVEFAFEQLSSRFDYYLRRLHKAGNSQRGIIIFDKSTYEISIQRLATDFRTIGHRWDLLRNLSEGPLFIDSKASRLIQLADLVAYALFKKYEHQDARFFAVIENRVDHYGGLKHGLYEKL